FEKDSVSCLAPQVFRELLRAEGFTDIRYVEGSDAIVRRADAAKSGSFADMIAHGEVDFGRDFAPSHVLEMNAGAPITILAGLHLGCFEVFGKNETGVGAKPSSREGGSLLGVGAMLADQQIRGAPDVEVGNLSHIVEVCSPTLPDEGAGFAQLFV